MKKLLLTILLLIISLNAFSEVKIYRGEQAAFEFMRHFDGTVLSAGLRDSGEQVWIIYVELDPSSVGPNNIKYKAVYEYTCKMQDNEQVLSTAVLRIMKGNDAKKFIKENIDV